MKRLLMLGAVLSALSGAASAGWTMIGSTTTFEIFVDPATVRKKGKIVKLWAVDSYYAPTVNADGQSYRSVKAQEEFDCVKEISRILTLTQYSEGLGYGEVVYNYIGDPGPWVPISPGTVKEAVWKFACGKVKLN